MQKFCHGNFTARRGTSTATPGTVVLPRPRPGEYSPVELRPTFSLANARSFGQGVMHPVGRAVRFAEAGERLDTQIPAALEVDDRLQRDLNPFSPDQVQRVDVELPVAPLLVEVIDDQLGER